MTSRALPRPRSSSRSRPPAVGFVLRFLLGCALAQALVTWVPVLERWAIGNTLGTLHLLLRAFGLPGTVSGDLVRVGAAQVRIVGECTPLMPGLILGSAILAFPALPKSRVLGVLLGALAIWLFNLVRIGALLGILNWRPSAFEFVHMYLWQSVTLLVMVAFFMAWLRLLASPSPR